MRNRKPNLREYKKLISRVPEHLSIKRELESLHTELSLNLRASKREHANKDYYKPKIDRMFEILRRIL